MIIAALAIKIKHVEGWFDPSTETEELRRRFSKADFRAKCLYIMLSIVYALAAITIIMLSFPVMTIMKQEGYNTAHMVELGVTVFVLSLILLILGRKIEKLNCLSGESFVDESS